MSNIVRIRESAEKLVGSLLGAPYKELPFQYDIETNDSRALAAGFAVTWAEGAQVYKIDQVVNMEQSLIVDLTKRVYVRGDDDKVTAAIDSLHLSCDKIIKNFFCSKIGLPAIIQRVQLTTLGEPTRITDGRDIVALRMVFRVSYLLT